MYAGELALLVAPTYLPCGPSYAHLHTHMCLHLIKVAVLAPGLTYLALMAQQLQQGFQGPPFRIAVGVVVLVCWKVMEVSTMLGRITQVYDDAHSASPVHARRLLNAREHVLRVIKCASRGHS